MWIGHFVLLFFSFVIEASKVDPSASFYVVGCWWLVAAVFVSAATPRTSAHSKHGAPFQNNRRQ